MTRNQQQEVLFKKEKEVKEDFTFHLGFCSILIS